jgi:hypothetical protein
MDVANTLTYFVKATITAVKCFMVQATFSTFANLDDFTTPAILTFATRKVNLDDLIKLSQQSILPMVETSV